MRRLLRATLVLTSLIALAAPALAARPAPAASPVYATDRCVAAKLSAAAAACRALFDTASFQEVRPGRSAWDRRIASAKQAPGPGLVEC
jgi:hypothetical protein